MARRTGPRKPAARRLPARRAAPQKPARVRPIPAGYHSLTPYLIVDGASRALEFYARAFGAKELLRIPGPGERVGHAEMRIGTSMIMLADEHPEMAARGPGHYGGSPASLVLYVKDVDRQFEQALAAGATEVRPVADQFYGDRAGTLKDPFGHSWHVHTHTENVSPAELKRRMAALGH